MKLLVLIMMLLGTILAFTPIALIIYNVSATPLNLGSCYFLSVPLTGLVLFLVELFTKAHPKAVGNI